MGRTLTRKHFYKYSIILEGYKWKTTLLPPVVLDAHKYLSANVRITNEADITKLHLNLYNTIRNFNKK